MDRIKFDNLNVLEQIDYVNSKITEGNTITKLCKVIGIGRTTIRDRFIKEGYIFNKIDNIYINDKSITKISDEIKSIVISKNNTSHKSNTIVREKNNTDMKSIEDFNNIKTDLLELIHNKDDLMEMLNNYKSNTNVINVPQMDINTLTADLQKDIITKSIKVYEPIYNLFDTLCKDYSSIKKQDLVSLALYEFYLRYKK